MVASRGRGPLDRKEAGPAAMIDPEIQIEQVILPPKNTTRVGLQYGGNPVAYRIMVGHQT